VSAQFKPIGPQDALWAAFLAALSEADLPRDDLLESNQRFYALVDGEAIGFGGYCRDGQEVLLRSIVVRRAAAPATAGVSSRPCSIGCGRMVPNARGC
jgi:hypothetical protein